MLCYGPTYELKASRCPSLKRVLVVVLYDTVVPERGHLIS